VALVADSQGRDVLALGLFDGQPHGLFGHHEAEAPMAIDAGSGGRLADHFKGGAGDDVAFLDAVQIGGEKDDAVGVVADQVGVDLVAGDDVGFVLGNASGCI